MDKYSWDNPELQIICGECHLKDDDPRLCHCVEPPMEKKFIPTDTDQCSFIRESYWQRVPQEQRDEWTEFIRKRSERYYSNNKGEKG